MLYRFESFALDLARGSLHAGSQEVDLRPKCFDLLRYLVENAGRLISKEEVLSAVWPDVLVTDKSLTRCISDVRAAIGDREQRMIKTVPRRGYLFAAAVTRQGLVEPSRERPLPDKPSIAVLAFTNMSGDPSREYFSDGITEDIITELSRFSDLFVIARNSSFLYKGKAIDVRQIGSELGVRYVLEGSVRRDSDQIRITAQLVDAVTGGHRWAERYDRELKDVFGIQDEVVRTIAAILAAQVNKAEVDRTSLDPAATSNAYDYYLRAQDRYASFHRAMNVATIYKARQLLDQCLTLDPCFARAYVLYSTTKTTTYVLPLDGDQFANAALDAAHQFVRKAIELDAQLPQAHAQLGYVLGFMGQHDLSVVEFERAFALNANFTDWRFAYGLVQAGQPARAVEVARAHLRLDPFCLPIAQAYLGLAFYFLRQYESARSELRDFVSRAPNHTPGRLWLAATYARLGDLESARAEVAHARRLEADLSISKRRKLASYKFPEDQGHLLDAWKLAGVPD